MHRTQSLACIADWHYSSLKAVQANNNIYIAILRKTLKSNLYLKVERICSYKIVLLILYSLRGQLNERIEELYLNLDPKTLRAYA